jgi:DnaJ-class molecular chaperone
MYVTLKIDPPAELSDEAKDLLQKFDEATSHDPRRDVPWAR